MAGSYQAGSVFVPVTPVFNGIHKEIEDTFSGAGDRAATSFADRWERNAGERLRAAADSLPAVEIDADSSEADRKLDELRGRIASLRDAKIGVDLDEGAAQAELAAIMEEVRALDGMKADLSVDVDAGAAIAELTALSMAVRRVNSEEPKVKTSGFMEANAAVGRLAGSLDGLATKGMVGGAIGAGLSAIIPAAAAAAAAVAGLGGALAGLGGGLGVLGLAVAPVVKAFQAQDAAAQSAGGSASGAAEAAKAHAEAVQSAADRVVEAQRGVKDAVESAAQSDQDAARTVADARRGVAEAHEQAMERVADAQKRVADARRSADEADIQSAKRVQSAREALAQAQIKAGRDAEAAARAVESAERQLASAQSRVKDAQKALTDARKEATRVLAELNLEVRKGALDERSAERDVRDAEKALKSLGSTQSEIAQAGIALADAQRRYQMDHSTSAYQAVQDATARLAELKASVGGTSDERQAAQDAIERAKLNLEEVKRRNADLAEQQKKAAAEGVDGSKRVQDAQVRLSDAVQAQVDAQRALGDARKAQSDRAIDSAAAVRRAEEAVSEARVQAARTHEAGLRRIQDAEAQVARARREGARAEEAAARSLADAQQRQVRTHLDGLRRIEDAQRRLAKSQQDLAKAKADPVGGASGGGGGVSALQQAMSKLTPEGKAFLELLTKMRAGIDTLSRTAQRTALPGITAALKSLAPAFGPVNALVGRLGAALGKLAMDGAKELRGPFWTGFGKMLAENLPGWLDKGARVMGNFVKILAAGFKAMIPVGNQFLDWLDRTVKGVADSSGTMDKSNGFKNFISYIQANGPKLQSFFREFSAAVVKIVKDLAPMGPQVLDLATKLAKFVAALPPGFFTNLVPHVTAFGVAVKGIKVGSDIVGSYTSLKAGIGSIIDTGKSFNEWGNRAATALDNFSGKAKMTGILTSLSNGVKGVATAMKTLGVAMLTPPAGIIVAIAALVTGLVLLYKNNEGFRKFVDGIVAKAKELGKAAFDWLRDKIAAFTSWLKKNWTTVLVGLIGGPVGLAVKYVRDNWDKIKAVFTEKINSIKSALGAGVTNWLRHFQVFKFRAEAFITNLRGAVLGKVRSLVDGAREWFRRGVDGWMERLRGFNPVGPISDAWNAMLRWLQPAVDTAKRILQPLIDTFNSVKDQASSALSRVPGASLFGFAQGGLVGFADGGLVPGAPPAQRGVDNLVVRGPSGPLGLRSGEFVQPQETVETYGVQFMEMLRRRLIAPQQVQAIIASQRSLRVAGAARGGFAAGGLVSRAAGAAVGAVAGAGATGNGIVEARLSREDAALLAELAGRPVDVRIGDRVLHQAVKGADRRFGGR